MKKIISLILALSLIFGASVALAQEEQKSKIIIAADDNFENIKIGDMPAGWSCDYNNKAENMYAAVQTDPYDNKNKCLGVNSKNVNIVSVTRDFDVPITGMVKIKYRYLVHAPTHNVMYVGNIPNIFAFMSYKDTYTYVIDGQNKAINNIYVRYDEWNTCEINLDFQEHKYTARVNDQITADNVNFSKIDLEEALSIWFGSAHEDRYVLIDDFYVEFSGEKVINYTKVKPLNDMKFHEGRNTLFNIPIDMTKTQILQGLDLSEGGIYEFYAPDGKTLWDETYLKFGCIMKMNSPDFKQERLLNLSMKSWSASNETVRKAYDCIIIYKDSPKLIIKNFAYRIEDGNEEIKTYEIDGENYVPLRMIAEGFGFEVAYDGEKKVCLINAKEVADTQNIMGRSFIEAETLAQILDKKIVAETDKMLIFGNKDFKISDERLYNLFIKELEERREDE